MGLSALVSVSSVWWKAARIEGAVCSASPPVPYGAAVTERTDCCTAACSSRLLLAVLGSVSCPSEARLEPLSRPPSAEGAFPVCWVPLSVIGVVGTAFRLGHQDAKRSTSCWGFC